MNFNRKTMSLQLLSSYMIQQQRCRFDFVQVDNSARHHDDEAENSEHDSQYEIKTAATAAAGA